MVKISCNEPSLNLAIKEDIRPASQITFNGKTYRVTHITKVERSRWELIGTRILGGLITAFSLGMLYVYNQKVRELFQKTRQLHVTVKEDTGRIPRPLEEKKIENPTQNPEHTQNNQKSEIEPQAKTPPKSNDKLSHLPGVLIKYPSGQEVYQVPVLNQVNAEGNTYTAKRIGRQRCGYHAFKNALIGLGVLCQQKGFSLEQLKTKNDYLVCKHAIDFVKPPNNGPVDMDSLDVGLANVIEALESLRFPKVELDPELKPYHELLLSQFTNIGAFNSEVGVVLDRQGNFRGVEPSGVLSGSEAGPDGLTSVANLYEFVSKKGPKVQAFITGYGDHWITLLLHEDEKGTRVWSALDSQDSYDQLYKSCIDMYEAAMQDIENFIMKSYLGALGGEVKNKTRLFETVELDIKDSEGQPIKVSKGKLLDPNAAGMLLKSARINLDMLYHGYNFMRRVGWLGKNIPKDSLIHGLKIQMTEYLRFYAQNLRPVILATPHLKEMVDALCGEMSKVESTIDLGPSRFMRKLDQDPNYRVFKELGGLVCKNVDVLL